MPLLEVKDLHVSYGSINALRGISFEVNEGEVVTLIGANGAGKSTTMNTIAGLLKPKQGKINYQGEDISRQDSSEIVKRGITLAPEGRQIFPRLTVLENLKMGAYTVPKDSIKENLEKAFNLFPVLEERINQTAGTLSGGEQQMLAVGRALMSNAKLLMLDEPSLGLAPLLVREIFELITRINELGTTVLLVEQNARMALNISDRGYVLETGIIRLSGKGSELAKDPNVVAAYLGGLH
jgi:branched-chain amino acid transport system ATP-binding protein